MRFRSSITITLAILLLVILTILLSFIERIRVINSRTEVEINAYSAQRNIAAGYNSRLWEHYDVFGLNTNKDLEKIFNEYVTKTTNYDKNNLYKVQFNNIRIYPHTFIENGGYDFLRQAALIMQVRIPSKLLKKLKGGDITTSQGNEKDIEDVDSTNVSDSDEEYRKDPRDIIKDIETDDGFVNFALSDEDKSTKKIDGNKIKLNGILKKPSFIQSQLFNEYILSHFTSAINSKNSKNALNYEVEYILKGGLRDSDNLKDVCRDIKLLRIPINYAYIIKNKAYNIAADILAFTLNIWNMNFATMKATKYAIIMAWAYAESAIDVKNLLSGGKVPLIKTDKTWNLGWKNLFSFKSIKPKKSEKGLSYDDYLRIFLQFKSNSNKVSNSMNLIEKNLDIKFKNIGYGFSTNFSYEIDKKFFSPQFVDKMLYKNEFIAEYSYK